MYWFLKGRSVSLLTPTSVRTDGVHLRHSQSVGDPGDSVRLLAGARSHEERLTRLVRALEEAADPSALRDEMRNRCVEARDQAQALEELVSRLLGADAAMADGPSSPVAACVLVVDDGADNRHLVSEVLEAEGIRTVLAANGLEAVIAAHCLQLALVVMDLTMPVLDGIEAARLMRASEATRQVKVVAYTSAPVAFEGVLGRYFDGVVVKPADPAAMLSTVQRFLSDGTASPGGR